MNRQQCFAAAAIVFIFVFISGNVNTPDKFSIVIPTPFSQKPFEFMVGFRNTFYLIAFAYTLTIIAVHADNFNLGVFSLLLVLLLAAGYNSNSENSFYVWQFALSPFRFLYYKIKLSLWHSFLLCSPVILILCIFHFERTGVLLFSILSEICDEIILLKQGRLIKSVKKESFAALESEMKNVLIGGKIERLNL